MLHASYSEKDRCHLCALLRLLTSKCRHKATVPLRLHVSFEFFHTSSSTASLRNPIWRPFFNPLARMLQLLKANSRQYGKATVVGFSTVTSVDIAAFGESSAVQSLPW